ncbi:MAG: Asp-tRNA(Asn)/Glu-tRNA(Gln) amidotransferase subunit GatC [Bacilli bacterium]|nr:Asp-tRNA(Asn)/Glu-tRNA(Gln) amidotransferase subunit GatC [Bacilli bacterium]
MKDVDINTLKTAVDRLMFELTDEEYSKLLEDFKIIMEHINFISEIDGVDEAEPMTFPFEVSNSFLREDVPHNISTTDALKNSNDVEDNLIVVPRVIK